MKEKSIKPLSKKERSLILKLAFEYSLNPNKKEWVLSREDIKKIMDEHLYICQLHDLEKRKKENPKS
jgi:hypothetical protein